MGVSYNPCGNPDCGNVVCDADPKLRQCESCCSTFCGDYSDSCNSVVELNCKEYKCTPSQEYHEEPPHIVCIKCVEGTWPSERFDAFLLKRAGFTTIEEAHDAFNEQQNHSSEEDSEDE